MLFHNNCIPFFIPKLPVCISKCGYIANLQKDSFNFKNFILKLATFNPEQHFEMHLIT